MTQPADRSLPLYVSRFASTPDAVRAQLLAVEEAARGRGIAETRRGDMQIVLGEVLNNIVEHAFAEGGGSIECRVMANGAELMVETRDDGRPLPPGLLIMRNPPRPGEVREDMPESGFGWFIVHSLTDDMTYERDEGTNLLSFSIR